MGKSDATIGGKPKRPKLPNERKQQAKAARDRGHVAPEIQIDVKGEFGDESSMEEDYRPTPKVLGDVIKQQGEICWAVALARLLQAIYNLTLKDITNFLEFMHEDLVQHLKPKEVNKKVARLELSNMKQAVAHIKTEGLLTVKSSGKYKPGGSGHHEKWEFKIEENATPEFIKEKLDTSPVAVSFHVNSDFQGTKEEIYQVKNLNEEGGPKPASHMVLIVGYGYTKDKKLFFLIQNSWGENWGVNGYARVFIDGNSAVTVIYPVV